MNKQMLNMKKDKYGQPVKIGIYPVGFYRDINERIIKRWQPRQFVIFFLESCNRKSYWNGFLAEPYKLPEGYHECGKGIIPILALWDLYLKTDGRMTSTNI